MSTETDLEYAKELLVTTRDWLDTAEIARQPTDPGSQSALAMAVASLTIAMEHLVAHLTSKPQPPAP